MPDCMVAVMHMLCTEQLLCTTWQCMQVESEGTGCKVQSSEVVHVARQADHRKSTPGLQ